MLRVFSIIMLLLLVGCSLHGEPSSQTSIIVHPSRDGSIFGSVRWSPDGDQISYIKDGELWVNNLKTGSNKKIVPDDLIFITAWIDSTTILYYASDGSISLKGNLWKVNTKSKDTSLLAKNVQSIHIITLYNKTVYLGEGNKGIRILSLDESNIQPNQLVIPLENGDKAKISPNGDKISFLDRTGREPMTNAKKAFLSLYDMERKEITQVEKLKNYKIYNYCWSPDGKYIAFAGQSQEDKVPNLYLTKMEGNEKPVLLEPSMNAADLDWSPTKNQLVVETVGQPGQNDIRLINIQSQLLQ